MEHRRIFYRGKGLQFGVLILVCCFLFASLAFASSGHEAVSQEVMHHPSILDTVTYWINFLVFVFVLGFIVKKPFLAFWVQRSEDIATAVNAGKNAEAKARKRLEISRQKYATIDEEVKKMLARIEEEGETEAKRLMADATMRAESIRQRGEEGLEAERGSLEVRLREEIAAKVLEKATEIIRERLDGSADRKLRDGVVGSVQSLIP